MRASSMPLAYKCRGSANLNKSESDAGPRQNSVWGRMGTAFHELAYQKVVRGTIEGFSLGDLAVKYGLSEEDTVDICRSLAKITITIPEGADVYAEKFIESNKIVSKHDGVPLRGTPDLFTVSRETKSGFLGDWKSGWLDVDPPESNWQLISYIFIVFEIFDFLETIEAAIIQPRFNSVKTFVFTRELVESMAGDLQTIVDEATDQQAPLTIGPWCHGCFSAMGCHAFSGQVIKISKMILPDMVFGEDKGTIQGILRESLPFAKAFMRIAERIDNLAKAYCDIHGTLELGGGMQYAKTVEAREEIDMATALPILRSKFPDSLDGSLKISKTALESLTKKKGERGAYGKLMKELESHGAIREKAIVKYVIKKQGEKLNDNGCEHG